MTAVALVVGLPLFLRSPPWCDITLYQMAARNLLHGGVHYRDLFDTNLPGFVWAMTALSAVFGPNAVVVRLVDLLVVLGVVVLLDRLAKWGGATPAGRWWAIAGAAVFYPFTVEMSHAQRDTWMALPGLAAVVLRLRRALREAPSPTPPPGGEGREAEGEPLSPLPENGKGAEGLGSSPFRASFCEGLLWGAAVWMKPHIVLMALVVWLLTARRLAGEYPRPWRAAGTDLLGNLLGGLAVGLPGVLWMIASDAWEPFVEVFTKWNPLYMKLAQHEFHWRVEQELHWFPPWSLWLVVTAPLALLSVLDMAPWQSRERAASQPTGWLGRWLPRHLWDKRAGADARFVRGALGGLYLVWAAQAFVVQRGFQYAHVPETLLMLAVWATHRWAWVPVVFVWLTATSAVWVVADFSPGTKDWINGLDPATRREYLPRHTITDPDRLRLWPRCWQLRMSDAERYALWDKLRLHPPHEASIGWEELNEVADFLRTQDVRNREVIAWFDSPHAVYLMLDLDPAFRYMHVHTAIAISVGQDETGKSGREWVLQELRETEKKNRVEYRYVISDLEWVALTAGDDQQLRAAMLGPPRNPPGDLLPVVTPYPNEFPFNQPTVFRTRNGTGRYIVHRVVSLDDTK
ncbi:MAG: hypothetical protein J0I06_16775 [Planctomycetes bacterium]|nr:hypothetical protein [Planctomycetota bacterium]